MKKAKLAFWVVILGFLSLIVYQNRVLFLEKQRLALDLGFATYQSPQLPVVVFFVAVFLLGWLIAFFFGLVERYKAGKTVKKLKEAIRSQETAIDGMKKDIEALKPRTEPVEPMGDNGPPEADAAEQPEAPPRVQQDPRG